MRNCFLVLIFLTIAVFWTAALAQGAGPQRCDGVDIANGPFAYSSATPSVATFEESSPDATTAFTVTAPSPNPETGAPNVFPGQGQESCASSALATFEVHDIVRIEDADGNSVFEELDAALDPLYATIASQFVFTDATHEFLPKTPGDSYVVHVTIHNPTVEDEDYGVYMVWMKAHAPGAGVGTGPGATIALTLTGSEEQDELPPIVTVVRPSGDQILGVIPVEIQATDPVPGTGVVSMGASVASIGGTVNQAIALAATLPVAAGSSVTGTGSFTPTGGTGLQGTTLASAFTSINRSGIGSYRLSAQATDGAGNTGFATALVAVKYAISFTMEVTSGCTGSNLNGCKGTFKFLVNRSNVTSDGAFMYDRTVVAKLIRASDSALVGTHTFGTTDPKDVVKIDDPDTVNAKYHTVFRHIDLIGSPSGLQSYRLDVYFVDVDGTEMLQGSSATLSF